MTTLLPPNVKVHLALGFIDMRKGIDGLSMLVQTSCNREAVCKRLRRRREVRAIDDQLRKRQKCGPSGFFFDKGLHD